MIDNSKLTAIIHLIEHFGYDNIELLKELSGVKNVEDYINFLEEKKVRVSPSPNFKRIGLTFYHTVIDLNRKLNLVDFYYLLNGFPIGILRDVVVANKVILDILFPSGKWAFIQILDYLRDEAGLINDYKVYMEYEREVYSINYEKFNFNELKFYDNFILDKPREPIYLRYLEDDFKPDWYDVVMIGKRQEGVNLTFEQIAKALGISVDEVKNHYYDHVIGKSLIDAFYVYIGKYDYRITLIMNTVKKEVAKELTRIPTLMRISYLHNDKIYALVVGQNHVLLDILSFINKLSYDYDFTYDVFIHPLNPFREYTVTASLPYEHFSKDGKWEISLEEMMNNMKKALVNVLKRE
ncbi:hypothetical protein DMP16_06585 [Sulfolobus sp. B1]|nr:hypothetical protein DJ528_08805 [Sulfolobus sp. B5]TRM78104.1 hypothetical protein DJ532_02495 [Sulfolobus sp. A20-N-F8]TRM82502.1 hypothetical protein DJ524_00355 [Sulfolobus sp. D5]TRM85560.1 hypothetical protein DJ522_00205 [Sulfolobus sp. F3]TRM88209.1 hypothetical protein DJ529_06045 [Sulfolobus sp. C3]TRM96421.1 hypothetical protein DMP16_06585 [Sulfolobus sp. B1]TRN01441.1 hypothetical protein DJ527_05490 [Sulfolobus sp. F1]TRN04061.1 hypothetical protein DJ530_01830 [Sulfolobus s